MSEFALGTFTGGLEHRVTRIEQILEAWQQPGKEIMPTKVASVFYRTDSISDDVMNLSADSGEIEIDGRRLRFSFPSSCVRALGSWWEGRACSYPADGGPSVRWAAIEMSAQADAGLAWPNRGDYWAQALQSDSLNFIHASGSWYTSWSGWIRFISSNGQSVVFNLKGWC
jgi:hypothetical protein